MTHSQLAALRLLPSPSPAMQRYIDATAAFFKEDAPGQVRAPAGRIATKDEMEAAWDALPYREREEVRRCAPDVS